MQTRCKHCLAAIRRFSDVLRDIPDGYCQQRETAGLSAYCQTLDTGARTLLGNNKGNAAS